MVSHCNKQGIQVDIDNKPQLFKRLEKLVKEMELPNERSNSPVWLKKHMHKKNKNHEYYQEALDIVTAILKKGWN
jgi:hypothetical protein